MALAIGDIRTIVGLPYDTPSLPGTAVVGIVDTAPAWEATAGDFQTGLEVSTAPDLEILVQDYITLKEYEHLGVEVATAPDLEVLVNTISGRVYREIGKEISTAPALEILVQEFSRTAINARLETAPEWVGKTTLVRPSDHVPLICWFDSYELEAYF